VQRAGTRKTFGRGMNTETIHDGGFFSSFFRLAFGLNRSRLRVKRRLFITFSEKHCFISYKYEVNYTID
jgi:hypothetical protein